MHVVVVVVLQVTPKLHSLVEDGQFGQQLQIKPMNRSHIMEKQNTFELLQLSEIDVYLSKLI